MKSKLFSSLILAGLLAVATIPLNTGCAHVAESSRTTHAVKHRAVALPPGWAATAAEITNTAAGNVVTPVTILAPGTNNAGFWASLVAPRPHVYVDWQETWLDRSWGGGTFAFTDPQASQAVFAHTNQAALGGGRSTSIGAISSTITTNAVQAITAGGTAAGDVIGATVKAAAGK